MEEAREKEGRKEGRRGNERKVKRPVFCIRTTGDVWEHRPV